MIRDAVTEDIPHLVELGELFHAIHPFAHHIDYDPGSVATTLLHFIHNPTGKVIVADHEGELTGVLLAALTPLYFNLNIQVVSELGWFVKEDSRGTRDGIGMFQQLEEWAKSVQAKLIVFSSIGDRLRGFFLKHGYNPYETHYVKECR